MGSTRACVPSPIPVLTVRVGALVVGSSLSPLPSFLGGTLQQVLRASLSGEKLPTELGATQDDSFKYLPMKADLTWADVKPSK